MTRHSRIRKFHRDVWRKARSKHYRPPGSEVGPELRKNWANGGRDCGHPRNRSGDTEAGR